MFASQRPLLMLPWIVLALFLSSAAGDPNPDCQRSCGNFSIDYPFGIGEGCFMPGFEVTCNASYSPPKPLLRLGADLHEVVDISVPHNQVRVRNKVFSGTGYGTPVSSVASIILTNTPFVLNNTANNFTVIGCNSLGLLYLQDVNITTGCFSVCNDKRRDVTSGSCSGLGCCQDSIPEGTKTIHVEIIENLLNDSKINDLYSVSTPHDNCGYAFVVDQESYRFEASDLDGCSSSKIESSTFVLDWVIGNETCEATGTSCKGLNSDCVGYGSGSTSRGYRCRCRHGYVGNPYLTSGCPGKDVAGLSHHQGNGTCTNSFGSYSCSFPLPLVLVFGCLLFVILLAPSVYMCTKRRELMNLKQKYFRQNGGFLLLQQIAFHEGSGEPQKSLLHKS
ncbi:hypothetical protein F3Y22_tig00112761pilonHSYRG00021 [Hibiscus syriacus]|uniref:Wall-associated receptor kinase galacturonan-binding domain-containing protein n=1 Tax=Hibiscus syriacus TaxID=106335 RepID=A0A6A2Y665_HIBSY|nr:hypothetical protein F3Y22_tig00112761pilonHSYRG00021 [Hibiscus syriacus]